MSNEIFKWIPDMVDSPEDSIIFPVIRSPFENGAEQRRYKTDRETGIWKFNYNMVLRGASNAQKLQDAIFAFFKARKGGYDNFWLPSWELEATILSATTNSITIAENPTALGFSAAVGDQGNYLYICNHYCLGYDAPAQLQEIRRISSIAYSSNYIITIEGTFTNSYSVGALLQKAFKVVFMNDELKRSKDTPYVWQYPLEFKEDIADLYTQVTEL